MKYINNKSFGLVLTVAFCFFFVSACSQPNKKNSEETNAKTAAIQTTSKAGVQTITGEILDMSCYMDHGAKGQGHKKCAQSCLAKGLPAGILAQNGQVYLLVEDHDAADAYNTAVQHAAENVAVTGKIVDKNGVQALIVKKVNVEV